MNYKMVFKLVGTMLKIEAVFMLFPIAVSFIYRESQQIPFAIPLVLSLAIGIPLGFIKTDNRKTRPKDAFAAATISWIAFSLVGALPFYFSGYFQSFSDCIFESVSGFTTTGATILPDIEIMPKSIIFWRSFSHWIGGVGVLVFMLAIMPSLNASFINLFRAETTGPSPDRFSPKLKATARVMYIIYLTITVALIILLLCAGYTPFDSIVHAFSTAATGGFSSMNLSIGAFNNLTSEIIIAVAMFLSGVNFALYFQIVKGGFKQAIKDEELRLYGSIILIATGIITINLTSAYGSVAESFRQSSFHVTSLITTTGFATADFNLWPVTSRIILTLLMLTGCCAGSTGGGIKLIRFLLLYKAAKIELNKTIHPQCVKAVTINGKRISNEVISKTVMYFCLYFIFFVIVTIVISFEGLDIISTISSVIAMLSNIGPGLGAVGPVGNYSEFSSLSKVILSFCMIVGRLEFIPALILFNYSLWRKS